MNQRISLTRRLASRLTAHAARILPSHRADWARAMQREVEQLADDGEAFRWAAGTVLASYRECVLPLRVIALNCALISACILLVEIASGFVSDTLVTWMWTLPGKLLPLEFLAIHGMTTALGYVTYVLGAVTMMPIAYLLVGALVRWAPTQARRVVRLTAIISVTLVEGVVLFFMILPPDSPFSPGVITLMAMHPLYTAVPMLIMLRMHHTRLTSSTAP